MLAIWPFNLAMPFFCIVSHIICCCYTAGITKISSILCTDEVYCALPPGVITVGSHMDSMASAEEGTEILFILCPGGGLFNATCTTGGWVPSLPQPPHECNDTAVTSRFPTTEANKSINGSFVCFAVTCIRCAPVISSLNVAIPTVPPINNSAATENGMSAGGLEGSGRSKQQPICCHFESTAQGMHELLLLCAWSSSHWDVPFLCMGLKPLGRVFPLHGAQAFSLHGAQATGTCLFSE